MRHEQQLIVWCILSGFNVVSSHFLSFFLVLIWRGKTITNLLLVLQTNIVSPYSVHQQQLAFLSQQQAAHMAAAKSSGSSLPTVPLPPNGSPPIQNWTNHGYQIPARAPMVGQNGVNNLSQVTQFGNIRAAYPYGSYGAFPTPPR